MRSQRCSQELFEDAVRKWLRDGRDILLQFSNILVAQWVAVNAYLSEAKLQGDIEEAHLAF